MFNKTLCFDNSDKSIVTFVCGHVEPCLIELSTFANTETSLLFDTDYDLYENLQYCRLNTVHVVTR